jgi:hypothetical protein
MVKPTKPIDIENIIWRIKGPNLRALPPISQRSSK